MMQDWRASLNGGVTIVGLSGQTALTVYSGRGVKNRFGGANLDMSSYKAAYSHLRPPIA